MTDFIAVGQSFVQHYYNVFDTQREVSYLWLSHYYFAMSFWQGRVKIWLNDHVLIIVCRVSRNCTQRNPCLPSRESSSEVPLPLSANSPALALWSTTSRASTPNPQWTTASSASFPVISISTAVRTPSSSLKFSNFSLVAQLATSATTTCSDLTTDEQR